MSHHRRIALVVCTMLSALLASLVVADAVRAQSVEYVALGDSYASGLGTREYIGDGSGCNRSDHAYPSLVADDLGADFTFAACAGATARDVIDDQLGALSSDTDLVTITVGGNDTRWASVIQQCAYPYPWTCGAQIDDAERFIREDLPGRLADVYEAVTAAAPNAEVIVLGYPRLFNGEECNAITRISTEEQAELNAAADLLAETIGEAAAAHGLRYVDVRGPFDGHAVCDDVEWVNGISWPIAESYHPNRSGQHAGYYAPLARIL